MSDDGLHPELTTSLDAGNGRAILRAAGEVDLYSAEDFTAALRGAGDAASRVVVDLTEVRFMDSTGLRALLQARRRAEESGGGLALVLDEAGPVFRLLRLAGVADLFERGILPSEQG